MSSAKEWVDSIRQAIADFKTGPADPGVKVTLVDGESFFLNNMRPGPGEDVVIMYPYPPGMTADLPRGADGYPVLPRLVVVTPAAVSKVELMTEPPGQREARFQLQAVAPPPAAPEEPSPTPEEPPPAQELRISG